MQAAAGIAKLNGDNWYQWEFDVQNALVLCGLDAAICAPAPAGLGTGGTDQGRSGVEAAATPDPEAVPTAALSASINARAHAFISSTVNAAKYRFVCQSCSTARELWQKLKAMHVSKVLASSSVLIQQMSMIRMQPGQPVQEYWQHAQELDQQIAACSAPDKPFHNSFSLAVLGLSADFDSVANQLLAEESTLTFDKALPRLLVQERVLISRRQAAGLALSARPGGSRDRSSNRGIGAGSDGGGGSRSGGDRGKGHGRRSKADSECYNCGQFGHYAYECPRASVSSDRRDSPSHSPRADRSRGDRPPTPGPRGRDSGLPDSRTRRSPSPLRHRSSLAFFGHSGADAALAVAPNLLKGQWLVDSGCSTHLTPHVELLRDYQPLRAPHHIVCGNGSTMTAAGQGSVLFEGAGGSMVLRNVLYVPDAEGSLLSVGKAARAGGEVVFTEQGCSIHMPGADHSSGGAVSSNSVSEGGRGGAPAVTPIAHVSSNSSSGGGGRAGSGGDPLAAPGSPGGAAGSPSGVGGSSGGSSGVESPAPMPAPALEHPPPLRRSFRPHKPTVKFSDYLTVCYSARSDSCDSSGSAGSSGSMEWVALVGSRAAAGSLSTEPRSFSEAMSGPEAEEWGRAMDAEMASQHANETWQLVKREVGMSVLPGRWVLKRKLGLDSSIAKYKARWVVKGFRQRDGVDYSEDAIFAPVVMHTTQRFIFALAVQRNWGLWQIDFKTAFLNSELTEADPLIYVEQPEGYEVGSGQVCQLLKTVYGLKQAPRAWYLCLRKQLELIGFHASAADPSLFSMRSSNGSMVHMLVYVDDCILASSDAAAVQAVKQQLQQAFEVHDMGPAADFLGMRISYNRASRTLRLSQQRYIEQLLQRFGKAECNGRQLPLEAGTKLVKEGELLSNADTHAYRELVGALLYASTCTRPDIALAVSQLTRFMQAPTADHERAAHGVLRYLKRTATDGLVYRGGSQGGLLGYCDSDYASDQVSYRSTTGYVFSLSGAAVSWRSKLQTTVAASTTEAEYQAAADATREALFLRKLMHELTSTSGPVPIFCDSQGAVALLKNPVESQRSKHIAVMHHMARERVWRGEVQFTYCPTADMVADVLTKALPGKKFLACKEGMGVG